MTGRDEQEATDAPASDDLPARMRRASERLDASADLSVTLGRLLSEIGVDAAIDRLVLIAVDRQEPVELAAYPSPIANEAEHRRIRSLAAQVAQRGEPLDDPPAEGASVSGPDASGARGRYAVPVREDGVIVAVLVGESSAPGGETQQDAQVVEAVATLVMPLLLVRRQLEDVRELDRLRSDFIARISHELRTPLTIITGFAGTLGAHEETLTTEQRHSMLDRIVTASIRLEHLIEEVLSLASVDAGLAEPQPKLVPVRDLVDLAVHDRGGTERVEVRGNERVKVHTDPDVARVVLGALVENALQQGEHVTVLIDGTGPEVRVAVEDDGPGVPPELGSRVFERFVRGDDRSPGMGLGLAIARRMAESIGARLWFENVDVGARFVAELPAMTSRRQSP